MSHITNMVICTGGLGDREAMERLNAWCAEHDHRQQQFGELDIDAAGGWKVFNGAVWAMAGNYFPARELADEFPKFGWRYPDDAVLIVYEPDGDGCAVYRAQPS